MLHEQPAHERKLAGVKEQPESTRRGGWIAFGFGLLLSFLTANSVLSYLGFDTRDTSFPPWTAWLPFHLPDYFFLLFPLVLGIILPFTGGILKKT